MNKELIAKQKKLLGLFFGTWALFLGNMIMLHNVIFNTITTFLKPRTVEHVNDLRNLAFIVISVFTVLQMWAIFKYILKK